MVRTPGFILAAITLGGLLLTACLARSTAPKPFEGTTTYIVHGYMAGPDDHWFQWLEREIEADGGQAIRLALPQSDDPDPIEWEQVLADRIRTPDRDTYIVAHSLGSITTLRYLSGLDDVDRLGGLLLVSGFSGELTNIPALDPYMAAPFDADRIQRMTSKIIVIAAEDDPIVPYQQSKALADKVGADFIGVETGGHFLATDGFTEFPLSFNALKDMVRRGD